MKVSAAEVLLVCALGIFHKENDFSGFHFKYN